MDLWLDEFFSEKPAVKEVLTSSIDALQKALEQENEETRQEEFKRAHSYLLVQMESINIGYMLKRFDQAHAMFPLYSWLHMYMRQVLVLMAFHRSVKDPQLPLYLASLEHHGIYCTGI